MDIDRAREFARRHHHAVLATRTRTGIQQSPVLVAVDDEGRFVVSSRETAYKTRNVRRDPWVQLCLIGEKFFGTWYYVEGEAAVLSLPDAMEPLVDYYRRAAGSTTTGTPTGPTWSASDGSCCASRQVVQARTARADR